jgi:hypothetical protein
MMRDTATPTSSKRPPAADPDERERMLAELKELRAKNAALQEQLDANPFESRLEFELELNRVNSLNFNLLAEVAALRRAAQERGSATSQGSAGSHSGSGRSKTLATGGSGVGTTSGGGAAGQPRFNQDSRTLPGLKEHGIVRTGPRGQPRLLSRRRSTGAGRTRRNLAPAAQVHQLPAIDLAGAFGPPQ